MKKLLSFALAACMMLAAAPAGSADAAVTETAPYEWKTMTIGAGGFMTGYLFHPKEQGLVYTRGDVGGVWRRQKGEERWVNLTNHFTRDEQNYYGSDGFAIDPQNPDVLYMAAGKYHWYGGEVFKSTDRGNTWTATGLKKAFSGNGNYRMTGECIAVDPANSNIVYVGTRLDGLYRSENGAASWSKISAIRQNDTTGNTTPIRSILFDKSSGTENGKTKRIYVSVIDQGLYVSEDCGATWNPMAGSPQRVLRMDIADDGTLYTAGSTNVNRYRNGTWTSVPTKEGANKGVRSVAVDPNNSDFVVCVYEKQQAAPIYYSTNGGATWTSATSGALKVRSTKYLEKEPFSANTAFVAMDPFHPKHIVYGDWFGLWETQDITATKTEAGAWRDDNLGIEQVCGTKTVSHPDSPYIALMAVGDQEGFAVTDLDSMQQKKIDDRKMMASADIDICEADANYVARVGVDHYGNNLSRYSADGGTTWQNFPAEPLVSKGDYQWSRIRFSSNLNPQTGKPASIVVIQSGERPKVSKDMGATWTEITSLPVLNFAYLELREFLDKDYVKPDTFYCCADDGALYVSTDGGVSWNRRNKAELTGRYRLKAAPGMADEVWFCTGSNIGQKAVGRLYRSSNGMRTMELVDTISGVTTFGFGKEAPGRSNPTVFAYGTVNGREGIYRSVDMGETWKQIDVPGFPVGNAPGAMDGSRKEFGMVFITTDGSGNIYGKINGNDSDTIAPDPNDPKYGNLDSLHVDTTGNQVTISGTIKDGKKGDRVNLLVYNPGYDKADWGKNEAVQNQMQTTIQKKNAFSFTFPLSDTMLKESGEEAVGYFPFYVSGSALEEPMQSRFSVGSDIERKSAVKSLNQVTSSDEALSALDEVRDVLLSGFDVLDGIDKTNLASALAAKVSTAPFDESNPQAAADWLKQTAAIEALNQNKGSLLTNANGQLLYAEVMDLSSLDENENLSVYETYAEHLNSAGWANVLKAMSGKNLTDVEEMQKAFAKAVVVEGVRNYEPAGTAHIGGFLQKNAAYVGLDMSNYSDAKAAALKRADCGSIEELQTALNAPVSDGDDPNKDPDDNSGKGSGSSGGGSGNKKTSNGSDIYLPTGDAQTAGAAVFRDLDTAEWAKEAVEALQAKGVISKAEDGLFRPNDYVTRAEFVKMAVLAMKLPVSEAGDTGFDDVPYSDWSAPYIITARSSGVVKGISERLFGKNDKLSRQDMAVLIYRLCEYKGIVLGTGSDTVFADDAAISDYARDAVYALCGMGVINGMGENRFEPYGRATRAQTAKVLYRLMSE